MGEVESRGARPGEGPPLAAEPAEPSGLRPVPHPCPSPVRERGSRAPLTRTADAVSTSPFGRGGRRGGRMNAALDVVTIGRSSVDLYGQQIGGRLEDMASFAKSVGGSPTKTPIGAARLRPQAGPVAPPRGRHFRGLIPRQLLSRGGGT